MVDFWHPDLLEQSERILAEINKELASSGDSARVRYFRIIPDPHLDGWVVLPVIELAAQGSGEDGWPLEEIFRYEDMVLDRFIAELGRHGLWATCLFRTPEELQDPVHQMGAKVPA